MLRLSVALVMAAAATAQQPANEKTRDAALQKLTTQLVDDQRKISAIIDNAVVQEYVDGLANRLAVTLSNPPRRYTITVVANDRSSVHEPIPLPGGYIFVPAQLLLTARNEAEFAGMLAHSMAHVFDGHLTHAAGNLNGISSTYVDTTFGQDKDNLPVPGMYLKQRPVFEVQADRDAAKAMAAAGFDPEALPSYIGRVQADPAGNSLSRYPGRADRLANLQAVIRELPVRAYVTSTEFDTVQAEIRRVLPETKRPVPSLVRNNPQPAR